MLENVLGEFVHSSNNKKGQIDYIKKLNHQLTTLCKNIVHYFA